MTRLLVCTLILAAASGQASRAQSIGQRTGGPYVPQRPQLNPYLNMLRGGSPAANFYMGVLPEMDRRAVENPILRGLEGQSTQPTPEVELDLPTFSASGHNAAFQVYTPFFGNPGRINQYFPIPPSSNAGGRGRTGR